MNKETFEVTQSHLDLLKNMYVSWEGCEFGAPSINCKRPYGNGDVEDDIGTILKWKKEGEYMSDEQMEKANKIHKETQTVLQIVLSTQKFEVGIYELEEQYSSTSWRKKK